MGTHPIFESDFDCLTEMQSETFKVKSVELNLELTCRLLKLPRAVFIWVGLDDTLGSMSVAVPSRDGKTSLSSIVIADSSCATQLASRIAKMFKRLCLEIWVKTVLSAG